MQRMPHCAKTVRARKPNCSRQIDRSAEYLPPGNVMLVAEDFAGKRNTADHTLRVTEGVEDEFVCLIGITSIAANDVNDIGMSHSSLRSQESGVRRLESVVLLTPGS